MKKLSEVCKITGLTRRTLQEYNRIGLLSPTSKTESGYWLYDDFSVKKLMLIQIFTEVGYTRKAVKSILEQPGISLIDEYQTALTLLEDKKRHIDGMINWTKSLMHIAKVPEKAQRVLARLDNLGFYDETSFSDSMRTAISQMSEISDNELKAAEIAVPFLYQLIAIACLKNESTDSKFVRSLVKDLFDFTVTTASQDSDWHDEDDADWNGMSESEKADEFSKEVQDVLSDEEICSLIRRQAGDGGPEYIIDVINAFAEHIKANQLESAD